MYNDVSQEFKNAMNEAFRNRMRLQVSLGVVNQDAQGKAEFRKSDLAPWSNPQFPWRANRVGTEYATLEPNYFRADGTMKFLPEGNYKQYAQDVGVASKEPMGRIRINFPTTYDLKGLTIRFGRTYPTSFRVEAQSKTKLYSNNSEFFETTDNFGVTDYITIIPREMVGGNQRLRIENIIMGVGLNFTDHDIIDMNYSEKNSPVAIEIPNANFSVNIFDDDDMYDVDNVDSFINYLQTGQKMNMSMGLELDDGSVEYVPVCTMQLSTWGSKRGVMTFTAVDRFSLLDDIYSGGYYLGAKNLYDVAEDVFTFIGLEPDEYVIDDCLRDVTINAPIPRIPCREVLQLIANAGRCILMLDRDGRIIFKPNFANVIDPSDVTVLSETANAYSEPQNITHGSEEIYADLTRNFFKADGSMRFKPKNPSDKLETGYISEEIADENGNFNTTPSLSLKLQAGFTYYGLTVVFDGNPPQEMVIDTYYLGNHVATFNYQDLQTTNKLSDIYETFDTMTFSFPKGAPKNRVLVKKISFGDLTDYVLSYDNILGDVQGFRETKVKTVVVKIFSYREISGGEVEQIEDNSYVTETVNTTGQVITIENPLIDSLTLANQVAEWLGFYYSNNVSYSLDYRGDPRVNATDLVYLESRQLNNLQAEVETHKLSYKGTLEGSMELRRAIRTGGT